jgi:phage terminase large subunit
MENMQETCNEIRVNTIFQDIFTTSAKYIILRGGSGSGKSYAVADYIILSICQGHHRWIVTRKYATTIRQSVYMLIMRRIIEMGLFDQFKVNKSEMYIEGPHASSIIFVGLDDVNKLKSLWNPTDAFMEEADQCTQDDFEEVDRRIRTIGSKPKIILAFNPTSIYSWLKKYFYDDCKIEKENVLIKNTTYKDNKYLNPDYYMTLDRLQETNPGAYRVYALGEWGVTEGVVFDNWQSAEIPTGAKCIGYGLDFGFSSDPAVLVGVYETDDARYYDEVVYRTGLTNPDLSGLMKECGIEQYAEIIADSAEPKSIEELHRMGWNVKPCVKGPDSIRFGINAMKTKKIFITPRSSNLHREFSSYSWKQDKNGNWLPEPIDMFNHGIDAARYRTSLGKNKVAFVI